METSDDTLSSPAPLPLEDATENATPTTRSAVPPAKPSSDEVLITEQQVMFSTAAAAGLRPENRLMAVLGRVFASSTTERRSRREHTVQRRMYYIESSRMEREMDRL
jgi:hypothetical protein